MNDSERNNRKKMLRILLVILNLTPTEIARKLHVSNSVISKHISGEKIYRPCDLFLIEVIFNIQIKEYCNICL